MLIEVSKKKIRKLRAIIYNRDTADQIDAGFLWAIELNEL